MDLIEKFFRRIDSDSGYDNLSMAQDLVEIAKEYYTKKCNIGDVVCSDCGAENSIRWDKHCIGIDDKQGSYKDLSFQFCEECGYVTHVDFS